MKKLKHLIFLAVICISLCSCSTMVQTDLYFGMNTPGGGNVTLQEWKNFSENVIAKHFPLGSTEYDAKGRYLSKEGETITENTKVVTLIGKSGKAWDEAMNFLIEDYRKRFKQQAVLRMDTKGKMSLVMGK